MASTILRRPYRSHRVPACNRCRSRKIRCHIDIPGEPCSGCRFGRLTCQYAEQTTKSSPSEGNNVQSGSKRRRLSDGDADEGTLNQPTATPILHRSSNHPSASIILAPHIAEDTLILQRHISQHPTADGSSSLPYQTLSRDVQNPVVYLTVPRFRSGLAPELGAGRQQLEIIQQLMGPFRREIIDLYLNHIHSNFPILDNETCALIRRDQCGTLPNTVLCVIYAMGLAHWSYSDTLKMHPRPDSHYIWNKAISAVLEDFLSPSMATVASSLLDQMGRPSVSIVGNILLCGRTVSLAQTFGLHRDPSKWNITENEKSIRIRTWWGVLITDYWSSIAYGVPPHISKRFHDVPKPTLDLLVPPKATPTQKYATTCFLHLCALTELLGEILPLVYEVAPDRAALSGSVARFKADLLGLERRLPEWLPLPKKPGTTNLWFCFLSMRLLLARVTLRAAILEADARLERERLDELREASSAVLQFVLWLGEHQFLDFWFPYATHLLVHAVTVSLRCTIEMEDIENRNASVTLLQRVMDHIRQARDKYDWDIANYCLERCSDSVSKVAALTARDPRPTSAPHHAEDAPAPYGDGEGDGGGGGGGGPDTLTEPVEDDAPLLSDLLDPNAFDITWEDLWNTPSGLINFGL